MKHATKAVALAVALVVALSGSAFAASVSTSPINVNASVDGSLSLQVKIFRNDIDGTEVAAMNFGGLKDIGTGTLRSNNDAGNTAAFLAYITSNSHGLPYTVTQTGTAMSNGSTTLPSGALAVKPLILAVDNGGTADGTAGTAGTWIGTKTLYTSTAAGPLRSVRAYYAITDDPNAGASTGVPQDQAGGNYAGTVTFTLTA